MVDKEIPECQILEELIEEAEKRNKKLKKDRRENARRREWEESLEEIEDDAIYSLVKKIK